MKTNTTDQQIITELESFRIKKYQLSEGELIHIKVNTFECKIKPENLETMIKRFKQIVNTDFSKVVTRSPDYKNSRTPAWKQYPLDKYCSVNHIN